jgi:phosphatidylserine/phosphatidylglycerophosphate/cardiolipin synthase-like enzyme
VLGAALLTACDTSSQSAGLEPEPTPDPFARTVTSDQSLTGLAAGKYRIQVRTPSGWVGTVAAWAAHKGLVNGGNPLQLHVGPYETCTPNDCDFILTPVPNKPNTYRIQVATLTGQLGVVAAWAAHNGLVNGGNPLQIFTGTPEQCAPNDCDFILTLLPDVAPNAYKIEMVNPRGQRGVIASWDAHQGLRNGGNPLKMFVGSYEACAPRDCAFYLTPTAQSVSDLSSLYTSLREGGYLGEGFTSSRPLPARLGDSFLLQTPNAWGKRDFEIPYYPYPANPSSCPNCAPGFLLPLCQSDADCASPSGVVPTGACRRPDFLTDLYGPASSSKVCMGHSDEMVDRIYRLISQADSNVDITTLFGPPDGRFLAAIQRGLHFLAQSGRQVDVRVLVGIFPPVDPGHSATEVKGVLSSLAAAMNEVPNHKVRLTLGYVKTCSGGSAQLCPLTDGVLWANSWNHSKIIAVDGKWVMVGGHNLWTSDYLLSAPVHDLSMVLESPAARSAHSFADVLWSFTCEYTRVGNHAGNTVFAYWLDPQRTIQDHCPSSFWPLPFFQQFGTPDATVMPVGRLGYGFTHHTEAPRYDVSAAARDIALASARKTIRVSQQDLAMPFGAADFYTDNVYNAMIDLMMRRGGDVYIALTDPNHPSYRTKTTLAATLSYFFSLAVARTHAPEATIKRILCTKLHFTTVRFNSAANYYEQTFWNRSGGTRTPVGNHAKFWMVDDKYFYIGSHNFYPANLQEFGYLVEGESAVTKVLNEYWNPLWAQSSAGALSGPETLNCYWKY